MRLAHAMRYQSCKHELERGVTMKKRALNDGPEYLRKLWRAYEYPGRVVHRDFIRLIRLLRRAYFSLIGRSAYVADPDEKEQYLWAERRE
jgi:hypothetical protein